MNDKPKDEKKDDGKDYQPPPIDLKAETRSMTTDQKIDRILEKVEQIKHNEENLLERERTQHAAATKEEQAKHAQFLRDAAHADDNWLQKGVRKVEEYGPVRKVLIPAGKILVAGGGTYVVVKYTIKGVKVGIGWLRGGPTGAAAAAVEEVAKG